MTVTERPPVPAAAPPARPPAASPPARARLRPDGPQALGAGLAIVAALLLGLLLDLGPLGGLRHLRDHETGYAELRQTLAMGTAPVGQLDKDGRPVRLGTPVALLEIPQLGLREVIREGTTGGVLAQGPGHRRDSPMPGQAGTSVLLGRQAGFGGPFGVLGNLRGGETFSVTTGQGTHTYRVLGLRRAGDPVPPAPADGAGRIALVTGSGPRYAPSGVLLVDADLITDVVPANARPLTPGALPAADQAMGTEDAAWIPLVLWGEGLLLGAVALAMAWSRWGRRQAWIVGVPVLTALALAVADQVARLLPNLV
ncbi:sortase domain-bontaining protein [Kitasatospora indigofera]|uniref:sortase domain-containing protein n=1 Tax=Kitasatospora indigofera TaxID=67307 RepID=UPI0036BDF8B4